MSEAKKDLATLYKDLRIAEEALAKAAKVPYKKWDAIRAEIAEIEEERKPFTTTKYAGIMPRQAIPEVLKAKGWWMKKKDVLKELEDGGQYANKETGRDLANAGIYYLLVTKQPPVLVTRDGSVLTREGSQETEIGLAEWKDNESMK